MVKSNVYEYKNIPETSTQFKLLNLEFGNFFKTCFSLFAGLQSL